MGKLHVCNNRITTRTAHNLVLKIVTLYTTKAVVVTVCSNSVTLGCNFCPPFLVSHPINFVYAHVIIISLGTIVREEIDAILSECKFAFCLIPRDMPSSP